jgi:hypothetical protein
MSSLLRAGSGSEVTRAIGGSEGGMCELVGDRDLESGCGDPSCGVCPPWPWSGCSQGLNWSGTGELGFDGPRRWKRRWDSILSADSADVDKERSILAVYRDDREAVVLARCREGGAAVSRCSRSSWCQRGHGLFVVSGIAVSEASRRGGTGRVVCMSRCSLLDCCVVEGDAGAIRGLATTGLRDVLGVP